MFGMISQKAIYGQSEGIIRAKNKIADQTGADLTGGMVWKFAPWVRVFAASDPETARVLMTLKPEYSGIPQIVRRQIVRFCKF